MDFRFSILIGKIVKISPWQPKFEFGHDAKSRKIVFWGMLAVLPFGASAQLMECDTVSVNVYRIDKSYKTECKGEREKLSLGLSSCTRDEAYYICKQDLSDEGWVDTRIVKVNRKTGKAVQEIYQKKRASENETHTTTQYENCQISSAKPKL